jgi:hypothetical protein
MAPSIISPMYAAGLSSGIKTLAPGTINPAVRTALINWTTRLPFSEIERAMGSPFQNNWDTPKGVSQFESELQDHFLLLLHCQILSKQFYFFEYRYLDGVVVFGMVWRLAWLIQVVLQNAGCTSVTKSG